MKRSVWISTAVFFSLALAPSPVVLGQAPPPEAATLQSEIARLNQSIAQLVTMLRENMERQRLDLMLRRVEILHLDLAPLQEELRSARADKRSLEEEQMRLQTLFNDLEQQMSRSHDDAQVLRTSEEDQREHDLKVQLKFLAGRVDSAEQRIVELENELADKRRQIDFFEGIVDNRMRSWTH